MRIDRSVAVVLNLLAFVLLGAFAASSIAFLEDRLFSASLLKLERNRDKLAASRVAERDSLSAVAVSRARAVAVGSGLEAFVQLRSEIDAATADPDDEPWPWQMRQLEELESRMRGAIKGAEGVTVWSVSGKLLFGARLKIDDDESQKGTPVAPAVVGAALSSKTGSAYLMELSGDRLIELAAVVVKGMGEVPVGVTVAERVFAGFGGNGDGIAVALYGAEDEGLLWGRSPGRGFDETTLTNGPASLLVPARPRSDLPAIGTVSLPPLFVDTSRVGVWGARFDMQDGGNLVALVYADLGSVYAELGGVQMTLLLLCVVVWLLQFSLFSFSSGSSPTDGVGPLRRYAMSLADAASGLGVDPRSHRPARVPRHLRGVLDALERLAEAGGKGAPMRAPLADDELHGAPTVDELLGVGDADGGFGSLEFADEAQLGPLSLDALAFAPVTAAVDVVGPGGATPARGFAPGNEAAVEERAASLINAGAAPAPDLPDVVGAESDADASGQSDHDAEEASDVVSQPAETARSGAAASTPFLDLELAGMSHSGAVTDPNLDLTASGGGATGAPVAANDLAQWDDSEMEPKTDNAIPRPEAVGGQASAADAGDSESPVAVPDDGVGSPFGGSGSGSGEPDLVGGSGQEESTTVMQMDPELLAQILALEGGKGGAVTPPPTKAPKPAAKQPVMPAATAASHQPAEELNPEKVQETPHSGVDLIYRAVFDQFVETRQECGEAVAGLTYDKFAGRLKKSHDAVVAKHGCADVRFTVYVKNNRAALKASPIR